eukprot:IDg12420t1
MRTVDYLLIFLIFQQEKSATSHCTIATSARYRSLRLLIRALGCGDMHCAHGEHSGPDHLDEVQCNAVLLAEVEMTFKMM